MIFILGKVEHGNNNNKKTINVLLGSVYSTLGNEKSSQRNIFTEQILLNKTLKWKGFPCSSAGKEFACDVGDLGSIPGLGRAPGEGKGYPLQYSVLENTMDCIVHGVTKSRTRLSDFHLTNDFTCTNGRLLFTSKNLVLGQSLL